jgi:hypothetical protein
VVVEKTVVVNKAQQSITFAAIAPKLKYEQVALASTTTSGLPVAFTVASGPGTITGNTVKLTGEGLVTVQAGQPGNENYEPGIPVQQTILVLGLESVTNEFFLRAFPNPTRGSFTARIVPVKGKNYVFTVLDNKGSIVGVNTLSAESNEVQFDLTSKPNGYYFLHVTDGKYKVVRIMVKY